MKEVNILITAASRKVAMIRAFRKTLNVLGINGKVVAVDVDRNSPGLYFASSHYIVPMSESPGYMTAIKDVCRKEGINVIIPTIDMELPLFGELREEFAKEGITVIVSSKETGEICNDKYRTYRFFRENSIPVPKTFTMCDIQYLENEGVQFPLFIKPRYGRGSIGCYRARNLKELKFFFDYVDNPLVQEFLPGREFTIDVVSDLKGNVISVVPRERLEIRAGVSDKGRTVKNWDLINYGKKISELLNIIGPSNIQCKVYNNEVKFIEVNPRFSGGIQLTINAGADFPHIIIEMLLNNIKPSIGDFRDNIYMLVYEDSIFKEF